MSAPPAALHRERDAEPLDRFFEAEERRRFVGSAERARNRFARVMARRGRAVAGADRLRRRGRSSPMVTRRGVVSNRRVAQDAGAGEAPAQRRLGVELHPALQHIGVQAAEVPRRGSGRRSAACPATGACRSGRASRCSPEDEGRPGAPVVGAARGVLADTPAELAERQRHDPRPLAGRVEFVVERLHRFGELRHEPLVVAGPGWRGCRSRPSRRSRRAWAVRRGSSWRPSAADWPGRCGATWSRS